MAGSLGISGPSVAQGLLENTSLVDIHSGSGLSDAVRSVSPSGFQLADGSDVRFSDWYTSRWQDVHVTWMTQLHDNVGFYWGFGAGERGQKYTIDPSLKLGFVLRHDLSDRSQLSLSATHTIGGGLSESSCTADYGAIGGVQTVNCRLAATELPPSETLQYLFDEPPEGKGKPGGGNDEDPPVTESSWYSWMHKGPGTPPISISP